MKYSKIPKLFFSIIFRTTNNMVRLIYFLNLRIYIFFCDFILKLLAELVIG